MDRSEELVARWRLSADADNPAGPLFTSGFYAEADLMGIRDTAKTDCGCGTACTWSGRYLCC